MTATREPGAGSETEPSTERKELEGTPDFGSPETASRLIGQAESMVGELDAGGLPAAERMAGTFETAVDAETAAELSAVAAEAESARTELVSELRAAGLPEKTEVGAEQAPDFAALAAALDGLAARYVGPDGRFDEDAVEKAPDDEREKVIRAYDSLREAIKSDPAGFLASVEALGKLWAADFKREFVERAAADMAGEDPERAIAAYRQANEKGLLGEVADEEALQSKFREFSKIFVERSISKIREQAEGDPIGAANEITRLRVRAAEAGVDTGYVERAEVGGRVEEEVKRAIAGGGDGVATYRRLADTAPGERSAAWAVAGAALDRAPGDFQERWAEKKRAAMDALGGTAPEALLVRATGQYSRSGWTAEERLELVEKTLAMPEGKRSVLAELDRRDLPEDISPEVRRALFGAYLAHRPEVVVDRAEEFPEEVASLPAEQRAAMIDSAISRDPYAVVRQAEAWRGALTERQLKDIVVSMSNRQDLDLHSDGFLMKKMPEVLEALTPDVVDAVIARQPISILEGVAEGKLNLSEAQKRGLVQSLAKRDELYREVLEELGRAGALTPEAVDLIIREVPERALRLITQGHLEASDEQVRAVMARRLEAGVIGHWERADAERLIAERGLKFAEEDIWRMLDSGLAGNNLGDAETPGFLKRLAASAEAWPRLTKLVSAAERVVSSPSASLRRLSRELLGQLREAEDPEATFDEVEGIFERNQLPLAGKLYKVFEVLNPRERLQGLASLEHVSPTLRAESHRGRMFTIYKDLLRAHLDSGNPSLRGYLETLREGQDLADKVDAGGPESLTDEERGRFESFVDKLKRLYESSLRGRSRRVEEAPDSDETAAVYGRLRESLGLKEGQSLKERVAEMYLKPIGLTSIEAALARMDAAKAGADRRNRELAATSGGSLSLRSGNLLKGFDDRYLRNVLENGSVAKEFLGASADSDRTPLDTDVSRVRPEDADAGFAGAVAASPAHGYGEMLMVVRDRGQFQETSASDDRSNLMREALKRQPQLELFPTGVVDERHYGIRTGFPSSEIDALVATERLASDSRRFDSRLMDIVANGQYIPVADERGRIILTPEKFDEYRRRFFGGLEGEPLEFRESALESAPVHAEAVQAIIDEKRREGPAIERVNGELREAIAGELRARGIETSEGFDDLLTSAEIYDTGSSSRGTNIPGSYDFDYIVKLNATDAEQVGQINAALVDRLGGRKHEGHRTEQLRLLGAALGGETADIDIGFVGKAETAVYESHDAVRDRLDSIRGELGEEACEKVVANIVLAKKLLKEAGAYKKFEDGGMGGIGVENWILSEGGSALAAFESFTAAAFSGEELRPLEEFKKEYKVLDPGINAKTGGHDNFIEPLTEDGYRKMAEAARAYLEKVRASAQAQ